MSDAIIGRAKGAIALAEKMTPEERSARAKNAAVARWGEKIAKETHPGILSIGNKDLRCGVIEGGIRVFSTRGFTRAMGGTGTGTKSSSENGAPQLPGFLLSANIKPFVSVDLMARLLSPIEYQPKHGGRSAFGYEAKLLPEICEVILDANEDGPLRPNQQHLVKTANTLLRGFARVGIIALVDEATGYQDERTKDELAKILDAYIEEDLKPYMPLFPNEFFKQIYRLYGWEYKPGNTKSPRYIGKFINKYIYNALPPGVPEELRKLNPSNEKYQRKHKNFQFLTDAVGEPHLDKQITAVTTIMKLSEEPKGFDALFRRVFAKQYQKALPGMEPMPLVIDVD
ncbi:MAG TPA: P63C domain-containing protein [Pyrinomonadaceae bacterium]|jgi:hypothetical protein|nr:P63C domain-containing protein [Pyrinomonadaceae bacterium]